MESGGVIATSTVCNAGGTGRATGAPDAAGAGRLSAGRAPRAVAPEGTSASRPRSGTLPHPAIRAPAASSRAAATPNSTAGALPRAEAPFAGASPGDGPAEGAVAMDREDGGTEGETVDPEAAL